MTLADEPPLICAIFENKVDQVRSLTVQGADVNHQDENGRSPLHAAAFVGNAELADILLLSGSRVNKKDKSFATPLHRACKNNNHDMVEALLRHGADPVGRDRAFETPLHVCAANDAVLSATFLIDTFVKELDLGDKRGLTPLAHAAYFGAFEMAELLLARGSDPNTRDKKGRRPIHLAAFNGHWDVIQLLLEAGAELEPKDTRGATPLHYAASSGNITVTNLFLKGVHRAMLDVNSPTKNGDTPLHFASRSGKASVIEDLIKAGCAVNAKNSDGMSPLHYAVSSSGGAVESAKLLLQAGADVNAVSNSLTTPLHMVAEYGRFRLAEILIQEGAWIDPSNDSGNTPLHYCAFFGHEILISALISHGSKISKVNKAGMTPVHLAAYQGYIRPIEALLPRDCVSILRTVDSSGRTPLHLACLSPNPCSQPLDLFIKAGSDPLPIDRSGRLPIHYASKVGNLVRIKALIEEHKKQPGSGSTSVSLNLPDSTGRSPLHYAAFADSSGSCVQVLLQNGADPNRRDNLGYQPLAYAAYSGNIRASTLLAEKCDVKGAIHLAAAQGHHKVIEKLMAARGGRRQSRGEKLKGKNGICSSPSSSEEFGGPEWELDRNGCTGLHWASLKGQTQALRTMLHASRHLPPVLLGERRRGITPLHIAAGFGQLDCLRLMMCENDEIDSASALATVDNQMKTPLMMAASAGDVETVSYILNQGVDPSCADYRGCNSLHRAASIGSVELCKIFLEKKERATKMDMFRRLPLHYAVLSNSTEAAKLLLDILPEDCRVLPDSLGLHPLHWAAYHGNCEIMSLLLERKTHGLFTNQMTETPLDCAVAKDNISCISMLVEKFGKDIVNSSNRQGQTPLHIAALNRSDHSALALLEIGAEVEAKNADGRTPLSCAATSNALFVAGALLKAGSKIDSVDHTKSTPLHHACRAGNEQMACLLARDVSATREIFDLQNITGKTALHLAAKRGLVSVVDTLVSGGCSVVLADQRDRIAAHECAISDDVADCLDIILIAMIPDAVNSPSRRLGSRISQNFGDTLRNRRNKKSASLQSNPSSDSEFY